MIRQTLETIKVATFAIVLPNLQGKGMAPLGTGFFVSSDGWFVTAAHVVTKDSKSDGPPRDDISKAWLMKEAASIKEAQPMLQSVTLDYIDSHTDFALLKVDFEANREKDSLKGKTGFPCVEVSSRELGEGEPVYSFAYPLSTASAKDFGGLVVGGIFLSPRTTSAIVSSNIVRTEMVETGDEPKLYMLDKALNFGNSGGPIVATETGKVHAFCSGFQLMPIEQPRLLGVQGQPQLRIVVPSLYGIVSSLANPGILEKLEGCGVPISEG